jgi:hypothetical protein
MGRCAVGVQPVGATGADAGRIGGVDAAGAATGAGRGANVGAGADGTGASGVNTTGRGVGTDDAGLVDAKTPALGALSVGSTGRGAGTGACGWTGAVGCGTVAALTGRVQDDGATARGCIGVASVGEAGRWFCGQVMGTRWMAGVGDAER